jgi:NitT/TauT family transport system substrate-binding protein
MTTPRSLFRRGIYFPLFVGLDAALWLAAFTWSPPGIPAAPILAVNIWPTAESLIVARETNLLPREKINFVEMSWSSASMRAFGNKAADIAVLSLSETVLLHQLGSPFRLILALDRSDGADAIIGREGLSTISDLRGKKVGVEVRSAGHYLLGRALEDAGLTLTDIELVPLNLPETETAFAELGVDAVVTAEPWLTRIVRKHGGRVIYDSTRTPGELIRVLVARGSTLDESRQALKGVVDAHFDCLNSDLWPAEVFEGILRREGLSANEFNDSLSRITQFSRDEQGSLLSGPEPGLMKNIKTVMGQMKSMGLIFEGLTENIIIDDSLISP